ncbi:MAG: hypothetical protein JXJ20_00345 [Anaerolineae bacterium]|nr:hypothetical protein [Anaerolineae bacterium]
MPNYRLTSTLAGLIVLLLALAVTLAACDKGESANTSAQQSPVPSTPTVPPVITRIVTPLPTNTPPPTPTLSYDLLPLAGRWAIRFDLEIDDSEFVDHLSYNGTANFEVITDGTLDGTGYFSQSIQDDYCDARVLDNAPLGFSVQGYTYLQGEDVWVNVQIIPDDPDRIENYAVICPTLFNDVHYRNEQTLWPMLNALNRLVWDFPLESSQVFEFESELYRDTAGMMDGHLSAEVRVTRY